MYKNIKKQTINDSGKKLMGKHLVKKTEKENRKKLFSFDVKKSETEMPEKEEKEKNMKILSPYTVTKSDKKKYYIILGIVGLIALIGIICYIYVSNQKKDDFV